MFSLKKLSFHFFTIMIFTIFLHQLITDMKKVPSVRCYLPSPVLAPLSGVTRFYGNSIQTYK